MTQSYDLILKGATVVSHDGEAVRDLAIAGGRIAAIGDLSRAAAGETIDCRGPASSTPRCIFAIPA